MSIETREIKPFVLVLITGTAIFFGAMIGGATSAINGSVSPYYFRAVLEWDHVINIWRASIAQGIYEGLLYGVLFALVFTTTVGISSGTRVSYSFAFRYLVLISGSILGCWVIGGLLAVGLATLSPDFYQTLFYRIPKDYYSMLAFAWVGGSIWGALIGALFALVVGSISFAARWKQLHNKESV